MPSIARCSLAHALTTLLAVLPAAQAHMSLWHPSMYGFDDWGMPNPLADLGFDSWWFHGQRAATPRETMSIIPGQTLTVEIGCGKHVSSWGNQPSGDACPNDSGSYHAGGHTGSYSGWGGNSDENLMGCALAIAYKSDVWSINPDDFIVMSVQERCVRQRDTPFDIPANLPACPPGGCTCAWFWQGQMSAPEMYMTGFKCNVEGGRAVSSYPRPQEPRRNAINGPTQPMYWGNDMNNIGVDGRGWNDRPSYTSAWGWSNGAQYSAFEGLGGGNGGGNSGGNGNGGTPSLTLVPSDSSATSTRTRTRTDDSRPTDWQNLGADPLESSSIVPTPTSTPGDAQETQWECKRRVKRSSSNKKKRSRHRRAGHGLEHRS